MNKENKQLQEMKQEYEKIEIPAELKGRVEASIKKAKKENRNEHVLIKFPKRFGYGAVAAVLAITILSNSGEEVAYAMSKIPVIGAISKVVTFRTYKNQEGTMEADIETPKVEGDGEAILNLNEEMAAYTKTIENQYKKDLAAVKEEYGDAESGYEGITTNYKVMCDNENILSIRIDTVIATGSSDSFSKCYTVDKQTGKILELSDLFKDNADYVSILSENIKQQMRQEMKEDKSKSYFLSEDGDDPADFKQIKADQNFYIDEDGYLNIVFDKYEVALGAMGECVFKINPDVIQTIVKNTKY